MSFATRLLAALGLLFGACVAQAAIIDTSAQWNGSSGISPFGHTNTATYGQTFVAPETASYLDSWTFFLNDMTAGAPVDFSMYVMAWDSNTTRATGDILFASDQVSTTNNGGQDGYEAFTFATGGLVLDASASYVAFISTSEWTAQQTGTAYVASLGAKDGYKDGGFFWLNNGTRTSYWTERMWRSSSDYGDLVFTAQFSAFAAVPEPGVLGLFLIGLLALLGVRRRINA
ncbi:PEP-CTERM sorting domain-containing protein [Marinimicrobium alkaliphilum]|uniref:PEP-CTERM sorting domain-containing protein n=1 Tax=Marinimicrobium alkaliphilum TaxID=2202654 RepID=UPI000DBA1980|nr:PEP-CTERM sorting domain-containing protein [Marinimicrobium alkaliphilum]